MKFRSRSLLATAVALASQGAFSADTYLNVFLESAPMMGIEVRLNGEDIGATDNRGASSTFTPAGDHKLELFRDGVFLTEIEYSTTEDQDAEISVTFTEKRSQPEVNVALFDVDDSGTLGRVGGVITDVNGSPIGGAKIEDLDGTATTTTDENGVYELSLPRGKRELNVSHPDYSAEFVEDLVVLAGTGTIVSLKLLPKKERAFSIEAPSLDRPIEEVLTLGSYKAGDTALSLERFSTEVIDAIDASTMARFGDGNIASALTRLAGVAVTGDKFANIRGLDGRYIASSLNGFKMPTTDPLSTDVELDIFPSGILENIQVQKTFSSNLLGTSTGGALQINTKGLPTGRGGSFSLKLGGKTGVTGDEILTHEGSNGDWVGYDLGLRDLSDSVLSATDNGLEDLDIDDSGEEGTVSEIVAAGYALTFEDDYNVKTKTANPDFSIGLSYGDMFDDSGFGYYASVGYGYGTSDRIDFELSDPTGTTADRQRSKETYSLDGYLVLGSQFRSEDEVLSKTIFLRTSEMETDQLSGIDNEENERDSAYLQWTERQFISQQFTGKHVFDIGMDSHELDWGLSYSNTNFYQPDRREYAYLSGFLILNTLERRWIEMDEDSVDLTLEYTAPFELSNSVLTEIKLGGLVSDKERSTEIYRFGWRNGRGDDSGQSVTIDQNLEEVFAYYEFALDTYRLDVKTTTADTFNSEEKINAFYLDTSTEFGENFVLDAGVRQQDFEQALVHPNADPSQFDSSLEVESLLPAVNLTFIPNDEWQFKLGASQTVSYPSIIEKTSSRFNDLEGRSFSGCPTCIESEIDNLDFRVEYYFSDEESISLALFNKEIDSPLEKAVPDGVGLDYIYRQSESATLNGVEIDGRLNLFDTGQWLGFISGNVALIESEVTLDDVSLRLEGEASQGRELQGQAPWLANLQFGLDHFPTGQKLTVLLNHFDDRIDIVERQPTAAFVEVGRTELNANYEVSFLDSMTIKAQLKNLLDEPVEYKKEGSGIVVESYNQGIGYSLEFGWEF